MNNFSLRQPSLDLEFSENDSVLTDRGGEQVDVNTPNSPELIGGDSSDNDGSHSESPVTQPVNL